MKRSHMVTSRTDRLDCRMTMLEQSSQVTGFQGFRQPAVECLEDTLTGLSQYRTATKQVTFYRNISIETGVKLRILKFLPNVRGYWKWCLNPRGFNRSKK